MCGIAGVINLHSPASEHQLNQASEALSHRGPDGLGAYLNGNVGLAHVRLSIIDLDGGSQPLHANNGNHHVVANGEIYNYLELQKQYPDYRQTALSQSDCEAILQVYRHEGVSGFKQLNGMFAFALHDQTRDTVIIARDRLGIKPLFYAKTPQGVVFASELKALLALMPTRPEINPLAFNQFLNYQFHTGADTIFKGVQRVLPGEFIEISAKLAIKQHQYWSALDVKPIKCTEAQALDEFDALFKQVMTEHIRSDVPFGLFLSGGIDSSVLLAKLSEMHAQSLSTYSIGFEAKSIESELDAAEQLARQFGSKHHSLRVNKDQLFSRIVRSIWAADDLMRDYAALPTLMLSEMASKDVKVVFSGEGGDEAFAGYRRYKPSMENTIKAMLLGAGGVRSRGQWQTALGNKLLSPLLKQQKPRDWYKKQWTQLPANWSRMQGHQYIDLVSALPDNLFVKADRMMMCEGLEGRVPFADHRIVEFGLSLPDELKYKKVGKNLIRQWLANKLPAEHLRKPKRGFYVPVNEWLSGDFLDQLSQKLVLSPAIQQWFNVDEVKRLAIRQQQKGDVSREIWGLMQFAIWHKLFLEDNHTIPQVEENPLDWIS